MIRASRRDHLHGDNRPSPVGDGDAPDLKYILDTVYRAQQTRAPGDEVRTESEPRTVTEAPVFVEPPPWRAEVERPRRPRTSPRRPRHRSRRTERGVVYVLWIATLAALVFALLLLRQALT